MPATTINHPSACVTVILRGRPPPLLLPSSSPPPPLLLPSSSPPPPLLLPSSSPPPPLLLPLLLPSSSPPPPLLLLMLILIITTIIVIMNNTKTVIIVLAVFFFPCLFNILSSLMAEWNVRRLSGPERLESQSPLSKQTNVGQEWKSSLSVRVSTYFWILLVEGASNLCSRLRDLAEFEASLRLWFSGCVFAQWFSQFSLFASTSQEALKKRSQHTKLHCKEIPPWISCSVHNLQSYAQNNSTSSTQL